MADQPIPDLAADQYIAALSPMACKALRIAVEYGGIDGAHHKAWVIDQMVRALMGSEEHYRWLVAVATNNQPEDWDTGIAP